MTDIPRPRRRAERGWGKLLLALVGVPAHPAFTPLRALLPVEETMLLFVPALAACALVGWWAGGRLLLAVVWVAARRMRCSRNLPRRRARSTTSCAAGVCCSPARSGWSACSGPGRPFFSRALGAVGAGARARAAHEQSRAAHAGASPARRAGGVRAPQRRDAGDVPRPRSQEHPEVVKSMPQVGVACPARSEGQLRAMARDGAPASSRRLLAARVARRARAGVGDVSSDLAHAPRRAARSAARTFASTTSSSGD